MSLLQDCKRIVIKVGSNVLTHGTGKLNIRKIESLAKVVSDFYNQGKEMVLVSSGAISAGAAKIGVDRKTMSTVEKQALAAIGQSELMKLYDRFFSDYGIKVAQLLLTKDIFTNPERKRHAENTFRALMEMGALPIVNENDAVSDDEVTQFGGNDILSAYVAVFCHADLLINMTDVDGLFSDDPRQNPNAKLISRVDDIERIKTVAGGAGSEHGTGGMRAKITAAEMCVGEGIPMFILNGADPAILFRLEAGENIGTYFPAKKH